MFRGDIPLSLDPKGRLAIPTRYRDAIQGLSGGVLFVTINLDELCLTAYPAPEWDRIEQALRQRPEFDPQAENIRRLLIGKVSECEMDSQGRILIPQNLREFAGLDRRVRMVGLAEKFELWDEDHWATRFGELREEERSARRGRSASGPPTGQGQA